MHARRPLTSVVFYLAFAFGLLVLVGGYLYVSRISFLRPVTGPWVGVVASPPNSADRRVLLLETHVSATHLFRPTLVGTVRMCSQSGDVPLSLHETRTLSHDTLGVMISSARSETSELFGALRGDGLTTEVFAYQGTLQRGGSPEFRKACEQIQH